MPLRFVAVAEFSDQQLDQVRDQRLRLLGGDQRQVVTPDLAGLAAMPAIGLGGLGMDAGDDKLLPIAEEFEFLGGASVGRGDVGEDLLKRRLRSETGWRAWAAVPIRTMTMPRCLEAPRDQILDRDRGLFAEKSTSAPAHIW